jgi:hypothetical protein
MKPGNDEVLMISKATFLQLWEAIPALSPKPWAHEGHTEGMLDLKS